MTRQTWIRSAVLLFVVAGIGTALASWKQASLEESENSWAGQPEPVELVTAAVAKDYEYRPTTTAIGTVLALRSVTLLNEVPGTVSRVALTPGEVVEAGTVLVALDVSVEKAELKALEAEARLAETLLERMRKLHEERAVSQEEVDRAQAERDVAVARVARTQALIDRKTIRAPFRARVGMSDVHPGQYLNQGTVLTTLQGVDDAVHVDFAVGQRAAASLAEGKLVDVFAGGSETPVSARIVAVDSRVNPATRNAMVRARLENVAAMPSPGASVRVRVPVGPPQPAVSVPVSALRKGPGGDHLFVLTTDKDGKLRAHVRSVQSGPMLGDEILIHSGISSGERVAATGSFKLHEAVLVMVDDDATRTAATTATSTTTASN